MLLEVKNINAGYGFLQILRDVSFNIDQGEYACIIGPNGAGKSTTMKTIAGLVSPMSGEIIFNGENIAGLSGNKVARKGIAYISEDMNLFTNMTVQENLFMGAYIIKEKALKNDRLDFVYKPLYPAEKPQKPVGGNHERRRAKNAGHRQGAHGQPETFAGGRTVIRTGPPADGKCF